jgi:hypothetical protein
MKPLNIRGRAMTSRHMTTLSRCTTAEIVPSRAGHPMGGTRDAKLVCSRESVESHPDDAIPNHPAASDRFSMNAAAFVVRRCA